MSSATAFAINNLPEELLTLVIRFVAPNGDARKLYHVCLTCQQWYRIASKIIVSSLGSGNIRSCLRHLLNNPTLRLSVSSVDAVLNLRPGGDMRVYGPGGFDHFTNQLSDTDLGKLRAEVLGLPEDVRNEYSFQKARVTTTPTHDRSRNNAEDDDDSEDLATCIQTRHVKKLRREAKLQKRMAVQKMVSEICLSSTDAMFTMILHWAVNLESLEISGDMSERSGSTLKLVKQAADAWLATTRARAARTPYSHEQLVHGGRRKPLDNLRSVTLLRIRGIFAAPFFFLPSIRNIHLIGLDLDNQDWKENPKSYAALKRKSPAKQLFLDNIGYDSSSLLSVVQLCEGLESLLICLTDGATTTADKAEILADCVRVHKESLVEIGIVDDRRYIPLPEEEDDTAVDAINHDQSNGQNDNDGDEDDENNSDALMLHQDSEDEQMLEPGDPVQDDSEQDPTQPNLSVLHGFEAFGPPPSNLFPVSAKSALRAAILDCAGRLKRFTLQLRGTDTLSWSNDDGVGSVADLRDTLDKLVARDENEML